VIRQCENLDLKQKIPGWDRAIHRIVRIWSKSYSKQGSKPAP
jgi:hypothetical protein